jgi:hypothetical protein
VTNVSRCKTGRRQGSADRDRAVGVEQVLEHTARAPRDEDASQQRLVLIGDGIPGLLAEALERAAPVLLHERRIVEDPLELGGEVVDPSDRQGSNRRRNQASGTAERQDRERSQDESSPAT